MSALTPSAYFLLLHVVWACALVKMSSTYSSDLAAVYSNSCRMLFALFVERLCSTVKLVVTRSVCIYCAEGHTESEVHLNHCYDVFQNITSDISHIKHNVRLHHDKARLSLWLWALPFIQAMISYHVGSVAQFQLAGDVNHPWRYLQPQQHVSEPILPLMCDSW